MKKAVFAAIFLVFIVAVAAFFIFRKDKIISPVGNIPKEKPLDKYTFENLNKKQFQSSKIMLGKILKGDSNYISQMFYYSVDGKKVSGQLNVPKKPGTYPVVVMFRGFVPKETYKTGIGTKRAGEVFAENGFITLAPDFLGYGESDNPSNSSIEERFQTYTTALTFLASLKNLNAGLDASYSAKIKADTQKTGIWGHSNGGHIALSVLAISSKSYPTVLWAPVSKLFPYSILYYTDDFNDHGKALRKVLADFEKDYDAEKYSPSNFYKWIKAPIQLNQGTADDAVPQKWSDQLAETLKKLKIDVDYFIYPGADHNLSVGWSTAVERGISFYNQYFNR
ncbi:MAG: dienelactone hydrolase family protein [Candidatus Levybacteria bacterium]|nr:dienelactone hydrolase family protein [Candidatus Levybacteria bacterium]